MQSLLFAFAFTISETLAWLSAKWSTTPRRDLEICHYQEKQNR